MKGKIFLGISCFLVSFILLFPYETLKERVLRKVSKETNINITVGRIWPTYKGPGLYLKKANVQYLGRLTSKGLIGMDIPWASVYIPWMSLVSLDPFVQLAGVIDKRSPLHMTVKKVGDRVDLDIKLLKFVFAPYLEKLGWDQIDVSGTLGARIKSIVDIKQQRLGKSDIQFRVDNFELGHFEAGGFNIPRLAFSSPVEVSCKSQKGKVFNINIAVGSAEDPLVLVSEGRLEVNAEAPQFSQYTLKSVITFSEQLKQQPSVELLLPFLDQFKADDGSFRILVSGDLARGMSQFPTKF